MDKVVYRMELLNKMENTVLGVVDALLVFYIN